jgi:hypothetical protein
MPGMDMDMDSGKREHRHPIHTIQDILNGTPPDMIEHEYKQGPDGSMEIKIKIPSRAEQAKQRAMQQAEHAAAQVANTAGNTSMPPAGGSPGNATPMSQGQGQEQGKAASKANVVVKIAMTPEDTKAELKKRFPEQFLNAMGLN